MFNGVEYIGRCLDSIYESCSETEAFEIICVDDFSTDKKQNEIVNEYCERYNNISLIEHTSNKRQGGARNTGINSAKGDYIAFIDQDDTFAKQGITSVLRALKSISELDILMVTAATITESGIVKSLGYESTNKRGLMTGSEFIKTQQIPWCPWCYIYNRNFIKKNNLKFEENVRFEDMDWVMKATILSQKIEFLPIDLIRYHISPNQTTFFGNDFGRIRDWVYMTDRVRLVAMDNLENNGAMAVLSHYRFSYNSFLKRYVWRLKFSEIKNLLKTYPPYSPESIIMKLSKYPILFALLSKTASPVLLMLWKLKRFINH